MSLVLHYSCKFVLLTGTQLPPRVLTSAAIGADERRAVAAEQWAGVLLSLAVLAGCARGVQPGD